MPSAVVWVADVAQIRVAVAVVQASSYSSDLIHSLGTSICRGYSPKKTKGQKKKFFLTGEREEEALGRNTTMLVIYLSFLKLDLLHHWRSGSSK